MFPNYYLYFIPIIGKTHSPLENLGCPNVHVVLCHLYLPFYNTHEVEPEKRVEHHTHNNVFGLARVGTIVLTFSTSSVTRNEVLLTCSEHNILMFFNVIYKNSRTPVYSVCWYMHMLMSPLVRFLRWRRSSHMSEQWLLHFFDQGTIWYKKNMGTSPTK